MEAVRRVRQDLRQGVVGLRLRPPTAVVVPRGGKAQRQEAYQAQANQAQEARANQAQEAQANQAQAAQAQATSTSMLWQPL